MIVCMYFTQGRISRVVAAGHRRLCSQPRNIFGQSAAWIFASPASYRAEGARLAIAQGSCQSQRSQDQRVLLIGTTVISGGSRSWVTTDETTAAWFGWQSFQVHISQHRVAWGWLYYRLVQRFPWRKGNIAACRQIVAALHVDICLAKFLVARTITQAEDSPSRHCVSYTLVSNP